MVDPRWPLDFAERWVVDPDSRAGMAWNRHIVMASNPDICIAFMAHGADFRVDEARATLAASAPALLDALTSLMENARPINWNDEDDPAQTNAWRKGLRVMFEATGLPVPTCFLERD